MAAGSESVARRRPPLAQLQRWTSILGDLPTGVQLAAISLLAVSLRVLFLGKHSFWTDEIYSIRTAQLSWAGLWHNLTNIEANMGIYYGLLHLWLNLGDSEAIIRLLSVIPGVLTIPVGFLLGARLFGVRTGLLAALLLAVNAYHIQYSQEARSYSLLVLMVMLSSLYWVRSIESPSKGNWAGYVIFGVLAAYLHFFGFLVFAAHATSLIFLSRSQIPWRGVLISGVVSGVLLAPLAVFISINLGSRGFISETSLSDIYRFLISVSGSANGTETQGGILLLLAILVPFIGAAVIGLKTWKANGPSLASWRYGLLITWFLLPFIAALIVSTVKPIFVPRFLIVSLPPMTLLAAAGLLQVRFSSQKYLRALPAFLITALLALSAQSAFAYFEDFEKEDWRGVTDHLIERWQPGDGIIYYWPGQEKNADYYLRRSDGAAFNMPEGIARRKLNEYLQKAGDPKTAKSNRFENFDRIWLILSHEGSPERREVSELLQSSLKVNYTLNEKLRFPGGLKMVLYDTGLNLNARAESPKTFDILCGGKQVTIAGTHGDDTLIGTPGDDVIHGRGGDDTISGRGGNDVICGGAGDDTLFGEGGDDELRGGPGNDLLFGAKGNDVLRGGLDNDMLDGGLGTDICHGDDGDDELVYCDKER